MAYIWTMSGYLNRGMQRINGRARALATPWLYAALLYAVGSQAMELPTYQAEYVAYRSGMALGEAKQQLVYLGHSRYKLSYQSDASLLFISDHRKEESLFSVADERILPYKYSFKRTGTGKNKSLLLQFDPQSQQIRVGDGATLPWQGEIDNQLYQLLIKADLAVGKTEFRYQTINDRGEQKELHFVVVGEETLSLPYGQLDTIKLKRVRENSRRETFVWLAPSLDYLLVRLLQQKDGSEQGDLKLKHYQPMPTASSEQVEVHP